MTRSAAAAPVPPSQPLAIDAAIFDLDGTLVDTMPLHYEAYRVVLAELGVTLDRDHFFRSIGGKAREVIPRLLGGHAVPASIQAIHEAKKARVRTLLLDSQLVALECAKLLPLLRGRLPLALASSGSREGIEIVLRRQGWDQYFDAVVTGEDVERGKPSPDAFLLAAQQLGVDPVRCLAFEDTDDGLAGATAAGMTAFDVRRAAPPCAATGE